MMREEAERWNSVVCFLHEHGLSFVYQTSAWIHGQGSLKFSKSHNKQLVDSWSANVRKLYVSMKHNIIFLAM